MDTRREESGDLEVDGLRLAFRKRPGIQPAIVWLGGYRSDMTGTKASALDEACKGAGRAFLRFDYSGHGQSADDGHDGTISRWTVQAQAMIAAHAPESPVLVGSSMGAWIALKAALAAKTAGQPVAGMVLIAPAPDFTADLVKPGMTAAERAIMDRQGWFAAGNGAVYSKALIDDGRKARVMTGPLDTGCPVRIIQGAKDEVVPLAHALKLAAHLPFDDMEMTLVPGGDHRLSRPEDIDLINTAVLAMAASGAR